MADSKITALTSIGTITDPAVDPLVIVDVSDTSMAATGTTKKVTLNNLLACSPTATLASATITGDLTVRTNKLAVTNTGVGILTATPRVSLDVASGNGYVSGQFDFGGTGPGANAQGFLSYSGGNAIVGSYGNTSLLFYTNGAEQMRLNATGLGVGASPASYGGTFRTLAVNATDAGILDLMSNSVSQFRIFGNGSENRLGGITNVPLTFHTNNSEKMQISASGNVGIGVTPSAWGSGFRYVQAGPGCAYGTNGSVDRTDIAANWYYNGGDKYINATGKASIFQQSGGAFFWLSTNTASGGAGSAMTLNTNMTLDASGNLIIGGTSQISSSRASITNAGGDQLAINATNTSTGQSAIKFCNAGTAQAFVWWDKSDSRFYVQNSSGGVYLASTATSWTSNSDERLKDIIEPISNAVSKVGSLRAIIGKYKNDETNTRRSFLIAQDVQSVLPEAVDASNPEKLGVAYTDVIPLLVAAIKELTARVQTLEAK